MKEQLHTGILAAALVAVIGVTSAFAGDKFLGPSSFRDTYSGYEGSRGNCYVRGDVGYAFSEYVQADQGKNAPTNNEEFENGYFMEGGYGCSFTQRLRAEIVYGYQAEKDFTGTQGTSIVRTAVTSHTLMANFYLDLGNFRRIKPYIGAGVGIAYNVMDEVGPNCCGVYLDGGEDLSLAWSVMAGFGYQLTPRTMLDIGYRYLDVGSVSSGRVDSTNNPNTAHNFTEMGSHQIKAGFRYQLGGGGY